LSSENLRLAIQKSGRLSDDSIELIKECGIDFSKSSNRLKTHAVNFPIELLFLRDDDITGYVADGTVDAGIVGQNIVAEFGSHANVETFKNLGFAKCRLSIAFPREREYQSVSDLEGLRIATTYPQILQEFLHSYNIEASIHEISGSVEIAPGIGLADAICDIVSTGSTLLSNGLKEVQTIFRSEAVLIAQSDLPENKQQTMEELSFRIEAVMRARKFKYIMLNAPDSALEDIKALIPGLKSPTVVSLGNGWSSFQSVVREDEFWDLVRNVEALGAQGILVMPIEKMVQSPD
jgi:ATP phosphoribosyltransferase